MTHANGLPRRGLAIFQTDPAPRVVEFARVAEEAGYEQVWLGDSQNIWREAAATLGAVAMATSRILVGTGVTNLVTRHVSVVASMWATLHELTGGRVRIGVGSGFTSVGTLGRPPLSLPEFELRIRSLYALLRGEEVVDESTGSTFRLDYVRPSGLKIPVYVAGSGRKGLTLAGRIGDGVIMFVGSDPKIVAHALGYVADGAREVGRSLSDIDIVLWVPGVVCADPAEARDRMRGRVTRMLMRPLPMKLEPRLMAEVIRIRANAGHYRGDYYHHQTAMAEHATVSDELVEMFGLAGTPTEVEHRLRELSALGVGQVVMVPVGPTLDEKIDTARAFSALGQPRADASAAGR